jgi:IS5 family transposase
VARQPRLFDVDERLRRLSDIGDQLEAFAAVVDFEMFRPDLVAALNYSDGTKGGRPPFDPVLMFKILVNQAQNNLSDDRAEFLINDRLPFMRFLGLGLGYKVPDAKTIWAFRERLTRAGRSRRCSPASTGRSARRATSRCRARSSMRASSRRRSTAHPMTRRRRSRRGGFRRTGSEAREAAPEGLRRALDAGPWQGPPA